MRPGNRGAGRFASVLCGLAVFAAAMAAQEPTGKDQPKGEPKKDDEVWQSTRQQRAAAAAQLIVLRNPATTIAARLHLKNELVWGELEFAFDFAPPLDQELLLDIVDGKTLPVLGGKAPDEIKTHERAIYKIYNEALINAFELPPEVFKKSARDNEFVKFPHVWNEPKVHRGKVIPLKGRLVRIRKYEAPLLAKERGVRFVHEGWVFGETKGAHPYALIFPVLPDGFEVTETVNRPITFYGYFIGKIKMRAPKGDIDVPLMIGPTIYGVAEAKSDLDDTPFSLVVLIGVVGVLVGLVAVICGISWWFRKGDSAIQAQLTARKEKETLAMMSNVDQWAVPSESNPQQQNGITTNPPLAKPVSLNDQITKSENEPEAK